MHSIYDRCSSVEILRQHNRTDNDQVRLEVKVGRHETDSHYFVQHVRQFIPARSMLKQNSEGTFFALFIKVLASLKVFAQLTSSVVNLKQRIFVAVFFNDKF